MAHLFYCGNQWGYTPLGTPVNIPQEFCNPPINLLTRVSGQFVYFYWTAPHDYLQFEIDVRPVGNLVWNTTVVNGTSILLELDPGTQYEWRVRTVCQRGPDRFSTYADGSVVTSGPHIDACTPVSSVSVVNSGGYYTISWSSTGAATYLLEIDDGVRVNTFVTNGTTFDFIPNRGALGPYRIRVTARCLNGQTQIPSPWTVFQAGDSFCAPPIDLRAYVRNTEIFITWSPAVGASRNTTYNIYLDGSLVAENYLLTNFTFTGLNDNASYLIEVRANCKLAFSDPISLTILTGRNPCNENIDYLVGPVADNSFQINFEASPGITALWISLNNGEKESVSLSGSKTFDNLVPSSRNIVRLEYECANGAGNSLEVPVDLQSSTDVIITNIAVTGNSAKINWTTVPQAYKYEISFSKPGLVYGPFETLVNEYVIKDMKPGVYDCVVTAYYKDEDGEQVFDDNGIVEIALPNCETANFNVRFVDPVTAEISVIIDDEDEKMGPVRIYIVRDDDVVIYDKIIYSSFTDTFAATTGPDYYVFVYRVKSGNEENFSTPEAEDCLPSSTTYSHVSCNIPGGFDVIVDWSGLDQIDVTIGGLNSPQQDGNQLFRIGLLVDGEWVWEDPIEVPVGTTTIPGSYPILGQYRFQFKFLCDGQYTDWIEYVYECPDVNVYDTVSVSTVGNVLTGNVGATVITDMSYFIELSCLGMVTKSYKFTGPFFEIPDLLPNRIYLGVIRWQCPNGDTGPGYEFYFTTGSEVDPECTPPSVDAFYIDNVEPVSPCTVVSQDWDLISAYIAPLDSDPTKIFMELSFKTSISTLVGEVLLPGGIMGYMANGCLPSGTTSLDIELVTGAQALVSPSAQIQDNGNIICSGSYESDGSKTLVVRIRGTYTKA